VQPKAQEGLESLDLLHHGDLALIQGFGFEQHARNSFANIRCD
jgi:hypothetical protein